MRESKKLIAVSVFVGETKITVGVRNISGDMSEQCAADIVSRVTAAAITSLSHPHIRKDPDDDCDWMWSEPEIKDETHA